MINSIILSYITFVYFIAFLLYLMMLVMGRDAFGKIASLLSLAGFIAHGFAIALRWFESYGMGPGVGHAPLSNMYESLIFFSWAIILLYLLVEWRDEEQDPRRLCHPACLPGHGLCVILSGRQFRYSAPGPRAEKQLAHQSCHHLLFRLCRIRSLVRNQYHVPLETGVTAIAAAMFFSG